MKVLVVDDMPIFRDPIAASLRLAGFETVCASNGQEALVAVKAHHPAVVLLDVSMPVMDGLTCLRAMRADPDVAKTPVILFTALSDKKYVIEAGKLGVHDYLLKSSFSLKELLARVIKYTGVPPRTAGGAPAGKRVQIAPAASQPAAETPAPPSPSPSSTPSSTPSSHATGPTAAASSQSVRRLLTREQCVARAEKALSAKTLSGAVAEVISLAASPRGNVSDLAPLIARDPLLSARVLQAANSAAYVSSRPVVSTIPDAVRQIGMATVRSIAAALGIFDAMPASAADGFNPIRCWQHSFAVAMLCERLCPEAKGGKDAGGDAGLAYLVGLCHDLGEILFHTQFANEYGEVVEAQRRTGRRGDELEREMLGMTRGELVQTIIGRMGLPDAIKEPIRIFHEGGAAANSTGGAMTRLLRVAENYANGLLLASSGQSTVAPLTRAECKAALGREEPKGVDTVHFRSEVFYTTGVLARLSEDEARAVMAPPFERTKARVCVVREASLSPLDPVAAALDAMAHVKVVDRVSAVEAGADGVVVLAPSDLSAGFPVEDMRRAAPNVLWLVGRVNGMPQKNAPVAPRRWPVRLDDLAAFALLCAGGNPASAAA